MSIKIAALLVAALMTVGVASASESEGLEPANIRLDDVASMQRGARLFFNYCSGCHSLQYLRYSRIAEDLQLDPKDAEKNFMFVGGKIGDPAINHMPAADATKWFGKAPPDLSLEARAKSPDWIYNYLKSFYVDATTTTGWNNTVFPNASMPNPLWELQGVQIAHRSEAKAGSESRVEKLEILSKGKLDAAGFDETARDITAFLQYVGEPAVLKRYGVGVWVILFLVAFTFLAFLLKHEYWRDVH